MKLPSFRPPSVKDLETSISRYLEVYNKRAKAVRLDQVRGRYLRLHRSPHRQVGFCCERMAGDTRAGHSANYAMTCVRISVALSEICEGVDQYFSSFWLILGDVTGDRLYNRETLKKFIPHFFGDIGLQNAVYTIVQNQYLAL